MRLSGVYIFVIIISSLTEPLMIMQCFSLSLITVFVLKSILSEMRIVTPAFFWFPFALEYLVPFPYFNSIIDLGVRWVSLMQHIYKSCFCIQPANLCLLVGEFNLLTFNVIINMYNLATIFLVALGLFLEVFSFSCVSWLEKFL